MNARKGSAEPVSNVCRRTVAIIGAGCAGLACARRLDGAPFAVEVFDKGHRPGGRIATRRTPHGSFDHGAQYFTANDREFRAWARQCRAAGMAAPWNGVIAALADRRAEIAGHLEQRWVGVPGMSAAAQHLAAGLAIRSERRIAGLERHDAGWRLLGVDGLPVGEAETVIVAVPAPQAVPLLAASPGLAGRAAAIRFQPCWAMMLGYAAPLPLPFDGAFITAGPLSWVARNTSKPGRTGEEAWVLHASPDWSRDHLEDDAPAVGEALRRAFADAAGVEAPADAMMTAHRWRYARAAAPLGEACLFDAELGIGACGDWCLGANVEAAFRSGQAMAETILAHHGGARASGGST